MTAFFYCNLDSRQATLQSSPKNVTVSSKTDTKNCETGRLAHPKTLYSDNRAAEREPEGFRCFQSHASTSLPPGRHHMLRLLTAWQHGAQAYCYPPVLHTYSENTTVYQGKLSTLQEKLKRRTKEHTLNKYRSARTITPAPFVQFPKTAILNTGI
jgi:hypothetical protein